MVHGTRTIIRDAQRVYHPVASLAVTDRYRSLIKDGLRRAQLLPRTCASPG
ncbi:MAG TPA: hypothetical protein VLB68_22750 [Pyrinomonadaceae bacterium]|nr:hypothetical protein [Pyrinomonadaceae bacterium]